MSYIERKIRLSKTRSSTSKTRLPYEGSRPDLSAEHGWHECLKEQMGDGYIGPGGQNENVQKDG